VTHDRARSTFLLDWNGLDWSRTTLGARPDWPATLQSTADLALGCTFPMAILWGEAHLLLLCTGHLAFKPRLAREMACSAA